jgi:hypothetical protein
MIRLPLLVLVLFSMAGTCAILAGYVGVVMLAMVNKKLPDDQQIAYFGVWHYFKLERMLREYKRLYPEGKLASAYTVLLALMALFLIATMLALVFTSPTFQ